MTINFFGARIPICDPVTGVASREFYLFLQNLFGVNGGDVDTEIALSAALAPIGDGAALVAIDRFSDNIGQSPAAQPIFLSLDDVLPVIGSLRDEIAMLRAQINDLQQGGPIL